MNLPDGSTLHATALPKWVRVVLNIDADRGRAFDAFIGEQFISSPRQWDKYPQWLMRDESFVDFCWLWGQFEALQQPVKVAA